MYRNKIKKIDCVGYLLQKPCLVWFDYYIEEGDSYIRLRLSKVSPSVSFKRIRFCEKVQVDISKLVISALLGVALLLVLKERFLTAKNRRYGLPYLLFLNFFLWIFYLVVTVHMVTSDRVLIVGDSAPLTQNGLYFFPVENVISTPRTIEKELLFSAQSNGAATQSFQWRKVGFEVRPDYTHAKVRDLISRNAFDGVSIFKSDPSILNDILTAYLNPLCQAPVLVPQSLQPVFEQIKNTEGFELRLRGEIICHNYDN